MTRYRTTPIPSDSAAIVRRLLDRVRRRRRWGRVARAVCAGLLTGAAIRLGLIAASWLGDWRPAPLMLVGTWLVGPFAGAALALARRDSWRDAAAAVDRHAALSDRTITALELLSRPPTPLAELQIAETAARIGDIDAAAVVPTRMPKLLPYAAAVCYLSVWLPICPKTESGHDTIAPRAQATTRHVMRQPSARHPRPRLSQTQPATNHDQPVERRRAAPRPPSEQASKRISRKSQHSSDHRHDSRASPTTTKKPSSADALAVVAAELDFNGFFDEAERGNRAGVGPDAVPTPDKRCFVAVRSDETLVDTPHSSLDAPIAIERRPASSTSLTSSSPTDGNRLEQVGNASDKSPHRSLRATNTSTAEPVHQSASGARQQRDELVPLTEKRTASVNQTSLPARPAGSRSNMIYDGRKHRDSKPAKKPPAPRSNPSKPGPSQECGLGLSFSPAGGYSGPRGNKSSESHSNGSGGRGGTGGKGGAGPAAGGRLPHQSAAPRPATHDGYVQSDRPSDVVQLLEPRGDSQGPRSSELWPADAGPMQSPSPWGASDAGVDELAGAAAARDDPPRDNLSRAGGSRPGNSPSDAPLIRSSPSNLHHREPPSATDSSFPIGGGRPAGAAARIETWRSNEAYQPAQRPWQAVDYDARPTDEAPPVIEEIPADQRAVVRRYFEAIHRGALPQAGEERMKDEG